MFEFIIRKPVISSAQKFLEKLNPKVNLHVPEDLPLPSVKELKKMSATVSTINGYESEMEKLSDEQLKAKTDEFKKRYFSAIEKEKKEYDDLRSKHSELMDGEEREESVLKVEKAKDVYLKMKTKILDDLLPEAFAVVRETGKRTLNMRHYDIQMVGGIVLNGGNIAEMTTGEGKTLVATLPAYLNALTGEGVHVITVNDYLASRDCEWMGQIHDFLGLTVGCIVHDMMPKDRQAAYACDITYGTNNEFGFDYLRDNMVNYKEDMVQRPHHFCIVDEVDSILVDEARTPLIISGPAEESTDKYYRANKIVPQLKGRRVTENDEIDAKYKEIDLAEGYDYLADEKAKSVSLTDAGEEKAAKLFGIDNLHEMATIEYRHHILQALKAYEFFKVDVDYVLRDGGVVIVDEFTGRLMPGRRWSDGLHQAVEAKENIKIARENQTLATITFQNYFRLYEKLSGMTGTAYTEATEFKQIYGLECIVMPTNKKMQRLNHPDSIYRSVKEKFEAVVEDVATCVEKKQPVLVGTISIERSEILSHLLTQRGIKHQVLNAKYHEQEANIISQAGRLGAVTIATNMAGRGTDIVLGGNAEFLAKNLASQKVSNNSDEDELEGLTKKFIEQFSETTKEEHEKVLEAGGLYVIGTERHESRRIDNQLRGRQGRQGDPGASRFYVSLEDDLMRLFASEKIIGLMDKLGMEEGQSLEHPWLSNALESAQRRVEGQNFEIRKHLIEFDNVMNRQREVIYGLRREILEKTDVKEHILTAIKDLAKEVVTQHLFAMRENREDPFDIEGFEAALKGTFHYDVSPHKEKLRSMGQEEIDVFIIKELLLAYDEKEQRIGVDHLRHLERILMLHTIDTKWKEHLYAMDQMKEGIGLRAIGQRDPVMEYKKEGFRMFQGMYISVYDEIASIIFKIEPAEQQNVRMKGVFDSVPQSLVHDEIGSMSDIRQQAAPQQEGISPQASQQPKPPVQRSGPKVGRNDPCTCGSGKKYKKCCGS